MIKHISALCQSQPHLKKNGSPNREYFVLDMKNAKRTGTFSIPGKRYNFVVLLDMICHDYNNCSWVYWPQCVLPE